MRILESLSWIEIASALGARLEGLPVGAPRGASIDTRTLETGDVFFALKGEKVDGHEHVGTAVARGASAVVVDSASVVPAGALGLVVTDVEAALFELGRLVRSRSGAAFVAITGSAGKTTAKDFTAELLAAKGAVLATRGNLNNHLGVPLTLARLEDSHVAAVIECGMNHAGEISRLVRLVRPTVAAITNAGTAHLEYFAHADDIARAKAEIFETLGKADTAVAPAGDSRLIGPARASGAAVRLFGEGPESSARATGIEMSLEGSHFTLHLGGDSRPVFLPAAGAHAVTNFLLASSIASALGVPGAALVAGALRLAPAPNRGSVKRLADDILLIDDTYNANPKALAAAIDTLSLAGDRRKVACIGDMLELGPEGPALHRAAGAAMNGRVDLLLGVGPLCRELVASASALPEGARVNFETSADLAAVIASHVRRRDAILVKGSRGMRMERVVEAIVAVHPVVQG
jgi:UDP-N-acetylmuramoyl-tripeptide--D-alanyl-D-alanine ligase